MDSVSTPVIDRVRLWIATIMAGLRQAELHITELQDAKVSREVAQRLANAKAEAAAINRGRNAQNNLAATLAALYTWTGAESLDHIDFKLAEVRAAMAMALEAREVWLKGRVIQGLLPSMDSEYSEALTTHQVEQLERQYGMHVEYLVSLIPFLETIP